MKLPSVIFVLKLLLLAVFFSKVQSHKILMVFPSHSRSHLIIGSAVLKGLAEQGHQVTMVSSFPQKDPIENYRDIYLEVPEELKNVFEDAVSSDKRTFPLQAIYQIVTGVIEYGNRVFGLAEVQKMMKEESFDLVIASVFGGRIHSGLAAHFNCPLVYLFPTRVTVTTAYTMGNPLQLATVPSMLSTMQNPMNFLDRVKSFFYSAFEAALWIVWDLIEGHYYNTNFPQPKYPSYQVASRNMSLVLSSHHFSQGPMANVPEIIEIGGIQMDTKLDPLPQNLQCFLDGATEGVIFFSFGTNVKLKKQNQLKIKAIFRALERTGMKVLLKYDSNEEIPGLSKNILSASWLPQREILAHPNVKLFISHGGLGSIMEAKYYGVPVLGIPIFGDQPGNIAMAVKEGWAVKLDFFSLTEQKLSAALETALKNSTYTETVKKLSNIYRDRPLSATETANYWIEYVIRHQGATHMRSSAKELNFFQRSSLDVVAFLSLICLVVVLFVKYAVLGLVRIYKFLFASFLEKKYVGLKKMK